MNNMFLIFYICIFINFAAYCFTTLHKNITQHQYKILMNYIICTNDIYRLYK